MLFRIDLYLLTSYLRIEAIEVASYEISFISYTIVFSFCALSFIKIILEAGALDKESYFACISLFIGVISLKQIKYKLFDLDPYYFKDRQNVIKDLIKNGLNDNLDFKKYNSNMLDCFIYRYLEAPYIDINKVSKCLKNAK